MLQKQRPSGRKRVTVTPIGLLEWRSTTDCATTLPLSHQSNSSPLQAFKNCQEFVAPLRSITKRLPGQECSETEKSLAPIFPSLRKDLQRCHPIGRRLDPDEEDLVNRHCVVLALFEEIYRSGGEIPQQIRAASFPYLANDLLALAADFWIEDVGALSRAFFAKHGNLTNRLSTLNPTFERSLDVGGADADLIVDDCFIELNCMTIWRDIGSREGRRWKEVCMSYRLPPAGLSAGER